MVVLIAERLPAKQLTIGTRAGTGGGTDTSDTFFAKGFCVGFQVTAADGVANQEGFSQRNDIRVADQCLLLPIRRDDFEISMRTEFQKSVARAAAGMRTTKSGAIAGKFLRVGDSFIEIAATEKDVI